MEPVTFYILAGILTMIFHRVTFKLWNEFFWHGVDENSNGDKWGQGLLFGIFFPVYWMLVAFIIFAIVFTTIWSFIFD
jgi:hypothetical protein